MLRNDFFIHRTRITHDAWVEGLFRGIHAGQYISQGHRIMT